MEVKSITIYSTVSCPYCKMEKSWLDKNNIKYTNFFVDEDQDKADEMIKKSGQMGVPVSEVIKNDGSSEVIVGFNRPKLAELLGIRE